MEVVMYNKLKVAVLYGGQSAEHDVSLMSAKNVINALDPAKYDILPIGIDKSGKMYLQKLFVFQQMPNVEQVPTLVAHLDNQVTLVQGSGHGLLVNLMKKEIAQTVDVIFPVLHGPYGEDGTIQGMIKFANIPCVGSDVLGSAICMDKDIAKRLLRDAKIPTAEFVTVYKDDIAELDTNALIKQIGLPCFVKPANQGSSIGKVKKAEDLISAIEEALQYDSKIIIEKFIEGREIECAVLGLRDNLMTTLPGEIIPQKEYYTYEAKYFAEDGAKVLAVANLTETMQEKIQKMSKDVFRCLECKGMARVDFFVTAEDEIYVNEVNTLPGFTQISQYPKMWEASGLSYPALLDKLIELANAAFDELKSLKMQP
jgi:D-alanine-D-alanine ligase